MADRFYAVHEQDEHRVRIVDAHEFHSWATGLRARPEDLADAQPAGSFPARDGEDIDRLLRANGWRRLGYWMPADDVLSGAVQCAVEPAALITNGGATS